MCKDGNILCDKCLNHYLINDWKHCFCLNDLTRLYTIHISIVLNNKPTSTHIILIGIKLIVLLQLQLKTMIDTIAYYNHFDALYRNLLKNCLINIGLKDRYDENIIILTITGSIYKVIGKLLRFKNDNCLPN